MVMVLDMMHVHNFHGQTKTGIKMLLLLELITVLLWNLVTKQEYLHAGLTQRLDDTTITAEAK